MSTKITATRPAGIVGMLVHGYYPLDPRVRREAEALASVGYEVDVVCLRRDELSGPVKEAPSETINGVRVHRLPLQRKRGSQLRYFYEYALLTLLGSVKLSRLHFSHPFHVVHIHNMPDFLVLAGLLPKWTGAKLVLDVHDPMAELYQANGFSQAGIVTRMLNWQQKLSCRLADRVVTVSEPMRENLRAKNVRSEKIFILHNFPDTRYFPTKEYAVWPKHPDQPVLLYCGTVTGHYRLDLVVAAVAIASRKIPGLRLRIIGEGNRLSSVRQVAQRLSVEERVEFLGPVDNERVRYLMADADIGVSSLQAGVFGDLCLSTKVLEYLSQGLPVVSSRTKTMLRYLPEDALFYFEPGDSEDMARQILRMFQQPAAVQRSLSRAREILPRYAWGIEKARLASFYGSLLAPTLRPPEPRQGKLNDASAID